MNGTKRESIQNRKCSYENAEQEMDARYEIGADVLKVYKKILPDLLKNLSKIDDYRNPLKIEHSLTMLMLYGILMFVFHMSSKREANRKMSRILFDNIKEFFPELDTLAHADTLSRLLENIDPQEIEGAIIRLVKRLIANKTLDPFKVNGKYIIAFDGTGKFTRDWEWSESCLKKHAHGQPEDVYKYYTYVLEASIVLPNGVTIPFMSEFLDRSEFSVYCDSEDKLKQDCETKSFKRLAERVKTVFPKLGIAATLDGLYANGPIIEILEKYKWDYMIILKDNSLKTVWEKYESQKRNNKIEKHEGNMINNVKQVFNWANDLEYRYENNGRKRIFLNLVICEETVYSEKDELGVRVVIEQKRFVWLSSKRLTGKNVARQCNIVGRSRWNIETQNLIEKHHGYAYQHCFSYDWQAMKCFHYLMHIGHILNILTLHFKELKKLVKEKGVRGSVEYIYLLFSGCLLDFERIRGNINGRYQYRFEI